MIIITENLQTITFNKTRDFTEDPTFVCKINVKNRGNNEYEFLFTATNLPDKRYFTFDGDFTDLPRDYYRFELSVEDVVQEIGILHVDKDLPEPLKYKDEGDESFTYLN